MSIRARILSLTAAAFPAVLAVSWVLFGWFTDGVLRGLGAVYAEQHLLYSRARTLQPLLRELALARKFADSETLRSWMRNERVPLQRAAGLGEMEEYRRFFADRSVFVAHARSGNYYFNDNRRSYSGAELRYTLDAGTAEDGWFFNTIAEGEPYRLNVDHDERLGVTKVWVNVVVRETDGRALGIVGTGLDLAGFLEQVVTSNHTGVIDLFVDGAGAIQAHPDARHIDYRTISRPDGRHKTIFDLVPGRVNHERIT